MMAFVYRASVFALLVSWTAQPGAQTARPSDAIVGGWTLNTEQSDTPNQGDQGREGGRGRDGNGGFGRGGGRRGGFGGGGGGGFGRGGQGGGDLSPAERESMERRREALRTITNPPDHLVIADTGSMIVFTAPDGRTTRLSPDGKKVKDENTGVERKTRWDGAQLVSEVSGLPRGKLVQTFSVEPERKQLHVVVEMEGGQGQKLTITHVYDRDER